MNPHFSIKCSQQKVRNTEACQGARPTVPRLLWHQVPSCACWGLRNSGTQTRVHLVSVFLFWLLVPTGIPDKSEWIQRAEFKPSSVLKSKALWEKEMTCSDHACRCLYVWPFPGVNTRNSECGAVWVHLSLFFYPWTILCWKCIGWRWLQGPGLRTVISVAGQEWKQIFLD